MERKPGYRMSLGSEMKEMGAYESQWDPSSFWTGSDADTQSLVSRQYQSIELCSSRMRKKLSKAEQEKIANASASELEKMIQFYMHEADRKQDGVQSGAGKATRAERGIHRFLDNFNGYVQAYSGIVAIMKGCGLGYGEAAYGALQMFLIISVNKEKTEDFINGMLVELRQQYHRLQMLKPAYATSRMREYTAVLYRLGIQFLYEVVRYYSGGAWRRVGYIFAHPPSIAVEKKVKEIKDAIRETEREMRALDGLRLSKMERVQADMERRQQEDRMTLGEVSTILNALQTRTDNDRLDVLRRLLYLPIIDGQAEVVAYETKLKDEFGAVRRLPPLDVERQVFGNPNFIAWRAGAASSLFLLHGATVAPDQTPYSWLSPAAVRIVSNFGLIFGDQGTATSPFLLTHYLFQGTDTINAVQEKFMPQNVVATLILQVLKSPNGKSVLHDEDRYAFLKQSLDALENGASPRQTSVHCRRLSRILSQLLVELRVQCLVVVVDRIDRLLGGTEKAVDMLADLMESIKVTVKVFATARSHAAFDDADVKERLEGRYARLTIHQDD